MALPDFLVIGAPKAGTTALHVALDGHPGLYLSVIKEPKFFLSDGPPPATGGPGGALTYREHVWRRPDYEALFVNRTIYVGTRDDALDRDLGPLERVLGHAWNEVPEVVRRLHTFESIQFAEGRCQVDLGRGMLTDPPTTTTW